MQNRSGILLQPTIPLRELLQRTYEKGGLDIYQDVDGVNQELNWFAPDNVKDRKLRPIQTGRGYAFTGIEYAEGNLPDVERTDVLNFSFWFYSADATTSSASIFGNYDAADPVRKGFNLYYFGTTNVNYGGLLVFQIIADLTVDDRITLVADIPIVTGSWNYVEVDYDGSGTGSTGVVIKVNGSVSPLTILFDTVTGTTVNSRPYRYGLVENYPSTIDHKISQFKFYQNGSLIVSLNSDEDSGQIAYDSSGNDNHGAITLGGTSESSFHITTNEAPSTQNELGYNKAGYFDKTRYGTVPLSGHPTTPAHFEVEILVVFNDISDLTFEYLCSAGVRILKFNDNTRFRIDIGGSVYWNHDGSNIHRIIVKEYNSTVIVTDNGVEVINQAGNIGGVLTGDMFLGTYTAADSSKLAGAINVYKFWELDISGNRVNELVNLDFSNGNTISVPNIAADAPANTDMEWNVDSGYSLVPVNQAIPTEDVLGNTLPDAYQGQVRYDTAIRSSNCAFSDGTLYGLFESSYVELPHMRIEFAIVGDPTVDFQTRTFLGGDGNNTFLRISGNQANVGNGRGNSALKAFDFSGAMGSGINEFVYESTPNVQNGSVKITLNGVEVVFIQLSSGISAPFRLASIFANPDGTSADAWGRLLYLKAYTNGGVEGDTVAEVLNYEFSEGVGLKSYNTATSKITNSNINWELNGSSNDTQWSTYNFKYPKNLLDGFNKAPKIGPDIGVINHNTIYETDDFELDVVFNIYDTAATNRIFYNVWSNDASDRNGWVLFHDNTQWRFLSATSSGTTENTNIWVEPLVVGRTYTVTLTKSGSTLSWSIDDGVQPAEVDSATVTSAIYYGKTIPVNIVIGSQYDVTTGEYNITIPLPAIISKLELVCGGDEVIKLAKKGDQYTIPNIATNKVSNSDMVWFQGLGEYLFIPADRANPTKDINGDNLENQSNGNILIGSENLYDRNFADAPKLVSAGVSQGENISYNDIIGDSSRFYNKTGNIVRDMLVYSDNYLEEPIAGGAYNFTGLEDVRNIPTGTVERTDTFYYKGRVMNGTTDQITALLANNIDTTPFRGFTFGMYNSNHATRANQLLVQLINDFAGGNHLTLYYYEALDSTKIQLIEIWYDGSSTLAGITVKIDGLLSEPDEFTDNLSATIVDTSIMTIAHRQSPAFLNGAMVHYSSEFHLNGTKLFEFDCDEGGGLVTYDVSGNKTNGTIDLGGSSETGFHLKGVDKLDKLYSLQYGKRTAGNFNTSRYIDMGNIPSYEIQNFRLTLGAVFNDDQRQYFFQCNSDGTPNNTGWYFDYNSPPHPSLFRFYKFDTGGGSPSFAISSLSANTNEFNLIILEKVNGVVSMNINGVDDTLTETGTPGSDIFFQSSGKTVIGEAFFTGIFFGLPLQASMGLLKFEELNSGGTLVNTLIDVDWKNGDINQVPNVATDAIAGTENLYWSEDGNYVTIPADINNYGFDVYENPIDSLAQVKKYRKINRYVRNND